MSNESLEITAILNSKTYADLVENLKFLKT